MRDLEHLRRRYGRPCAGASGRPAQLRRALSPGGAAGRPAPALRGPLRRPAPPARGGVLPRGPDGGGGDAGAVRPPGDGGGTGHPPSGGGGPGQAGLHLQSGGLSDAAGAGAGLRRRFCGGGALPCGGGERPSPSPCLFSGRPLRSSMSMPCSRTCRGTSPMRPWAFPRTTAGPGAGWRSPSGIGRATPSGA